MLMSSKIRCWISVLERQMNFGDGFSAVLVKIIRVFS